VHAQLRLVVAAYAEWLKGNHRKMISYFVPAVLIFRFELLVLLGPLMLYVPCIALCNH